MRDAFIARLTEHATRDPKIVLVTGDLGFGVLTGFAQRFPGQFLNAGVAEQNMTGVATGLAMRKNKPPGVARNRPGPACAVYDYHRDFITLSTDFCQPPRGTPGNS